MTLGSWKAAGVALLLLVLAGCTAKEAPTATASSAAAPAAPTSDAPAAPTDPATKQLVTKLNAARVCEGYKPIPVSEPVDNPPKASAECLVGEEAVVVSVFGSPDSLRRYLQASDESLRGLAVFDVAVGDTWLVNCGDLRDRCQQAVKVLGGTSRRVGSEN